MYPNRSAVMNLYTKFRKIYQPNYSLSKPRLINWINGLSASRRIEMSFIKLSDVNRSSEIAEEVVKLFSFKYSIAGSAASNPFGGRLSFWPSSISRSP